MSGQPTRVLLVEDDPGDARLIRELLTGVPDARFDLERVDRLSTALEHLEMSETDVVLLDLSLPDSQGLDTFVKVRAHARDVAIMMLTTLDDLELAVRAVREGAQDYLVKDRAEFGELLAHAMRYAVERKRIVDECRRSEERYRAVIENATYGIYQSSIDGSILMVNPAFVRMLGYESEGELRGANLARDVYLNPGDRARIVERVRQADRIDEPEVQWKRKDGTSLTVRLSGRPVRNDEGELECFEMIAEDVTERLALETQLRQAQKMEAVGQLTGGIAHDFNNILTAVLGFAELIASDVHAPHGKVPQWVGEIHKAAQQGAELVKKLMAFSRQERLRKESLNVAQVCKETGATLRRVLPEHIDLHIVTDETAGYINADRGAVEQIVFNLATNARDAMPDGGQLRITTERVIVDERLCAMQDCGTPGDYVCVAVSDTGIGMTEETKARIFEPFFTTKPVGQGTGLGMAMVYGLMKQHDGFVTVHSAPGHETTVKTYFPLAQATVPLGTSKPRLQARGGRETILLVEDEKPIRHLAGQILERYGYTVLTAADGEQALLVLRAPEPAIDLVLTDVIMPNLGGWGLYQEAVTNGDDPKFLFTSGYPDRDVRGGGKVDPTMPFLSKPWTTVQLLSHVRAVLDGTTGLGQAGEG